ncbi:hypothetical protein [Calothrix sp. PCC 6303]|uniref:hypothetical protein n=1 Tax=Calothrix sp. PCC 6303 TaxID=1170562 RepID=UPI0002A01636|nr:hypothetical protein [Calothrix sp. PCC 6303]AFZ02684.1 hypothetical protein Cal6303_3763 [Calothrix sp. PCC 6303]
MVDRINDIAWQASQGSVAAIIQILNQELADSGVRTRAVFADGVLQLLCEAQTTENLEKSSLVSKIQQTLESIAPRNIHRVNINSRIVREQQLLWLDEIHRDGENQLLWCEEIYLEKPGIFKQFSQNFPERKSEIVRVNLPKTYNSSIVVINNKKKRKKSLLTWLLTILFVSAFLGATSWGFYILFANQFKLKNRDANYTTITPPIKAVTKNSTNNGSIRTSEEYFLAAVRIANDATITGKTAKNKTQWLELAANWQRASDLMGKVQPDYSRYQEAQIRAKLYQQYSEVAQKEAEKNQLR